MDIQWLVNECHDPDTLKRLFYFERYVWLALSQDMTAVISTDGIFEDVNNHWEMATGHSRETLHQSYLTEYIHFDDREQALAEMQRLITADIASTSITLRFLCAHGNYCRTNWNVIYSPDHEAYFCMVHSLTETDCSAQQAYHGALTGLKNRLALDEHLPRLLAKAQAQGTTVTLLFLDLDTFKEVNDTLGHKAGDSLLMRTAKRLTECIGKRGDIYHLSGDEFLVTLTGKESGNAKKIAKEIIEILSTPYSLDQACVYSTASLGSASFPADATHLVDLLDKAARAMGHVKRSGKNGFISFDALKNTEA